MLVPIAYFDGLLAEVAKCFVISALVGGGAGAYLALRKDSVADTANKFGAGLIGLFD